MRLILESSQPLAINREAAVKLGLNEAIVLQRIHCLLEQRKRDDTNFREGKTWTLNSIDGWQEESFPFWSRKTIIRTFERLEKRGLILTGCFNPSRLDRTKWYTIDYEHPFLQGETDTP